jgi:hypothetical protein
MKASEVVWRRTDDNLPLPLLKLPPGCYKHLAVKDFNSTGFSNPQGSDPGVRSIEHGDVHLAKYWLPFLSHYLWLIVAVYSDYVMRT